VLTIKCTRPTPPLHPHPREEERLGVDDKHVLVDLKAYVKVSGIGYKGVSSVPGESPEDLIEQAINWLKCGYRAEAERQAEIRRLERGLHNLRAL